MSESEREDVQPSLAEYRPERRLQSTTTRTTCPNVACKLCISNAGLRHPYNRHIPPEAEVAHPSVPLLWSETPLDTNPLTRFNPPPASVPERVAAGSFSFLL